MWIRNHPLSCWWAPRLFRTLTLMNKSANNVAYRSLCFHFFWVDTQERNGWVVWWYTLNVFRNGKLFSRPLYLFILWPVVWVSPLFSENLYRWYNLFIKCWREFTSEAVLAWSFLCEVLNYEFNVIVMGLFVFSLSSWVLVICVFYDFYFISTRMSILLE